MAATCERLNLREFLPSRTSGRGTPHGQSCVRKTNPSAQSLYDVRRRVLYELDCLREINRQVAARASSPPEPECVEDAAGIRRRPRGTAVDGVQGQVTPASEAMRAVMFDAALRAVARQWNVDPGLPQGRLRAKLQKVLPRWKMPQPPGQPRATVVARMPRKAA